MVRNGRAAILTTSRTSSDRFVPTSRPDINTRKKSPAVFPAAGLSWTRRRGDAIVGGYARGGKRASRGRVTSQQPRGSTLRFGAILREMEAARLRRAPLFVCRRRCHNSPISYPCEEFRTSGSKNVCRSRSAGSRALTSRSSEIAPAERLALRTEITIQPNGVFAYRSDTICVFACPD
jgi:hypothetical protein